MAEPDGEAPIRRGYADHEVRSNMFS